MKYKSIWVLWILFFTSHLSFASDNSPAYFAEIYGYRSALNTAAMSHTFASFYKVESDGKITRADIGWIPQDAYMHGWRDLKMPAFGDYPGQNLSLEDTLSRASVARPARTVTRFGPYDSTETLFLKAEEQIARLRSGSITYRGLDMNTRPYSVNCVHAVTSMVGEFLTGLRRGPAASAGVAEFFYQTRMLKSLNVNSQAYQVLHSSRPSRIIH